MSDDFQIDKDVCEDDRPTMCVESQEWTYGIDNTGTRYQWADATYRIELSDGSTIEFTQSAAAGGGWTPQMAEWGANIQAAADDAGLAWFVETRFLNAADYADLAGGGGFPGPPSTAVGNSLGDGGMRWRYVNIQICPGQPVPTAAYLVAVDDPAGAPVPALPYNLTTAGAVLGPIQKFWLCTECGDEPEWFLDDGVTPAEAGQIPNCWEPCGTLALTDAPPDRECEFFFDLACDDVGQNDPDNFVQQITRRATVCNGEQIAVDYFTEDPTDPTALVEYPLVGDFVDCDSGEPVPLDPCIPATEVSVELVCVNGCGALRREALDPDNCPVVTFIGANGEDLTAAAEADGWKPGACSDDRCKVDTCFLPDQYAIVWAWNGSGRVQSYDPLTDTWTDHGNATLPDGTVVGGYALAFKNDTTDPTLFFQVGGNLYKSSPDNPTALTLVGPAGNSSFGSSYPCLAFDPSGRLLVGIGSGSTVGEIDPTTGQVTTLGTLIDVRDGAPAQVGPGDWFFDPSGRWFLMARDTRGATFGQSTGTVLWEIDPATLEITRLGNTSAPTSGTGAAWLAANQYLLSTGGGGVYVYNALADPTDPTPAAWELLTTAPAGINDLGNQWVIPEAIQVVGFVDTDCAANPAGCVDAELFTVSQDEITGDVVCGPFPTNLRGKFGVCEPEANPYVTDPFAPGGDSGCDTCPDEDWHQGCSQAGYTAWRRYYDAAGNQLVEYLYGTLTDPVPTPPSGFTPIPCGEVVPGTESVTAFCVFATGETIYRRQETLTDGTTTVSWFNEAGTIPDPDPASIVAGECDTIDPLLSVTDETVCYEGDNYVRRVRETYVLDGDGLPTLSTYQILYFNENGTLWDSGTITAADPVPPGEPDGWYLGECVNPYVATENVRLCEVDARFLLLVDSGGQFARYSFYDKSITPVPIPVPSAGSGADIENFLLYAITSSQELMTVDVNTNTVVSTVPLFTNDGSPTAFSAAAFDNFAGRMLAWDYTTDNVYQIDTATGEVSYFNGPWTGISGTGSSFAVNPVDGTFIVSGATDLYEIGNGAGDSGAATVAFAGYSPRANGMTFDADGLLYTSAGTDTAVHDLATGTSQVIIDDWTPGANSLAYYEVEAPAPACFHRRFGVLPDGSREIIGDFQVADDSPRTIVGDVDCCECSCTSSGGGSGSPCCAETNDHLSSIADTVTTCPTGEAAQRVTSCDPTCQVTNLWRTIGGTPGVNEQQWQNGLNAAPHGNVTDIFTDWQTHINGPADLTQIVPDWNDNDSEGGNVPADQTLYWGWIRMPEAALLRDVNGNTGERLGVYIGENCCPPRLVAERTTDTASGDVGIDIGHVPAGLHLVAFQMSDLSAFGGVDLEYSTDGGASWARVPAGWSFAEKPVVECVPVFVCDDGTVTDLAGDLVTIGELDSWCPPPEPACSSGSGSSSGGGGFVTGLDSELFTSALVVPSAPAGTKEMLVFNDSGAWIEVTTSVGTQLVPPGGTAEWRVDDTEPDLTVTSVSLASGSFGQNGTWGVNYRTRT